MCAQTVLSPITATTHTTWAKNGTSNAEDTAKVGTHTRTAVETARRNESLRRAGQGENVQPSMRLSPAFACPSLLAGTTFPAFGQAVRETDTQCLKVVKAYASISLPGPKSKEQRTILANNALDCSKVLQFGPGRREAPRYSLADTSRLLPRSRTARLRRPRTGTG